MKARLLDFRVLVELAEAVCYERPLPDPWRHVR